MNLNNNAMLFSETYTLITTNQIQQGKQDYLEPFTKFFSGEQVFYYKHTF